MLCLCGSDTDCVASIWGLMGASSRVMVSGRLMGRWWWWARRRIIDLLSGVIEFVADI